MDEKSRRCSTRPRLPFTKTGAVRALRLPGMLGSKISRRPIPLPDIAVSTQCLQVVFDSAPAQREGRDMVNMQSDPGFGRSAACQAPSIAFQQVFSLILNRSRRQYPTDSGERWLTAVQIDSLEHGLANNPRERGLNGFLHVLLSSFPEQPV